VHAHHEHGAHHHHRLEDLREADRRRLAIALGVLLAIMAGEVVAGVVASSLALISDAGHLLTDAGALGLALVAARLAARPPRGAMTYGLGRAEALSALVNGIALGAIGVVIAGFAIARLLDPPEVEAGLVLVVALAGAAGNVVAARVLAGSGERSVNVEGAYQHVLTDLYAFLGTALAAVVILTTGWDRADPLAALVVALVMVRSAAGLIRSSGRIVMEAAPEDIDPDVIGMAIARLPGVTSVHDLHVWELTTGFPALSAHVLVPVGDDCHARRAEIEQLLADEFGIAHTTLQMEHAAEPALLHIERQGRGSDGANGA
jgi:cobalt-zinc-cadmium efflux system protein